MKNITLSVSDDIYRAARVYAAEHDTSVSGLVAQFLGSLSAKGSNGEFERLEAQQRRIQGEIQQFSAGARLGRDEVHARALR